MADSGQLSSAHVQRWRQEREDIRAWINQYCWSQTKQSYTFHSATEDLDAATLLVARTGFCAKGDPRLYSTVQQGKEGAFLACSGWLVEALHRIGRTEEATRLFDDFASRANDLGLYSEQIDPVGGELLGNLPQALTHLAVISAAAVLTQST